MNEPERDLEQLAVLVRRGSELNETERDRARADFLARALEERPTRIRAVPRAWQATLAAAALAALAAFVWWPRGLDYEVHGAASEGGYVRAAGAPANVTFSDHTQLVAAAGTRLRVVETAAEGARVLVEQGQVQVHVVHRANSAWSFVAGPFAVRVTGTRFDFKWDAEREQLEVVLHEGSVEIAGYSGSGPVAVRAGQRFSGDARERRMLVTDAAAPVAPVAPPVEEAAPSAPPDAPAGRPAEVGSAPKAEAWSKWMAKGEFQRVVDEATSRGLSTCMAACNVEDLRALADAARYTNRGELAEKSLLALRQRFAGEAGRSAFLLGRLAEGRGQNAAAQNWYETYLRESPSGSFASEALAGTMRMVNTLQGKARAVPIAREYLRRYPTGVHAATARQLVDSP